MPLLEVDRLSVAVQSDGLLQPVVREISFTLERGATLGIVGESGCGKSLTSLAIMGLLAGTPVRITGGHIRFDGRDLLALEARERRRLMGAAMAMIFQEPMTSLNPVYRVGDQIIEAIEQHRRCSRRESRERARELLQQVRIPDPAGKLDFYPHQLSGGMRQRVMIAIALASDPALLIADEPTTALDVTVQAQILDLLLELQRDHGMAILLISHDLGVIAETCNRVAVMYRGQIVERASSVALFAMPRHPYTLGLMRSVPNPDVDPDSNLVRDARNEPGRLDAIPGRVPAIDERVDGCAFHPRCSMAEPVCRRDDPAVHDRNGHESRCHFADTLS